jgi:thioredoxin-like negative regulator of GroEL
VSLYEKYKGRVQFVIVDLDRAESAAQQALVKKFYRGSIPHVTILDSSGNALYDQAGEADEASLSRIVDSALRQQSKPPLPESARPDGPPVASSQSGG